MPADRASRITRLMRQPNRARMERDVPGRRSPSSRRCRDGLRVRPRSCRPTAGQADAPDSRGSDRRTSCVARPAGKRPPERQPRASCRHASSPCRDPRLLRQSRDACRAPRVRRGATASARSAVASSGRERPTAVTIRPSRRTGRGGSSSRRRRYPRPACRHHAHRDPPPGRASRSDVRGGVKGGRISPLCSIWQPRRPSAPYRRSRDDRLPVAGSMRGHMRAGLPPAALMMAARRQRPDEALIRNSDRGSKFTSAPCSRLIIEMNAKTPPSRPACRQEIAPVESFCPKL